ncbi:uncharacterized protein LOC116306441 [Actinia tenebrosa]|uniref:Uncharacterized protein LOC116306441 n=1 Tax=Actinia tenebrosa TaxID=6105 RepID=A0A6P8J2S4_ACTTE|nr:uncharacterized protein LOC116306441 [Actinia tenebrosa]
MGARNIKGHLALKKWFFIVIVLVLTTTLGNASRLVPNKPNASIKFRDIERSRAQNDEFFSSSLCNSTNETCSLNIKQSDIDDFLALILDKEALAVFMYVTLTNDTEDVDDGKGEGNGKVFPLSLQKKEKWAWLRNRKAKFLATLPYDFDILSLTTLTKDVYDLTLKVNSTPSDCYLKLSSNCLQDEIAKMILNNIMADIKMGTVCQKVGGLSSVVEDHGYNCCHQIRNGSVICNAPIKDNKWVKYALTFLWAISFSFGLLSPLLLNYLPKEFKKGGRLKRSSCRGMKKSDSCSSYEGFEAAVLNNGRQVMISKDSGLLDIVRTRTESTTCSRISRCLFVILLSLLPILQTLLYQFLKKSEVGISNQLLGVGSAFLTLLAPTGKYVVMAVYCFCILLVAISMAIPKTLSDLARRLSGRKDEQSFLGFKKPPELICHSDKRGFQLMYENMVFHLNCLMMYSFWKFVFSVMIYPLGWSKTVVSESNLDEEPEDHHEELIEENKSGTCSKLLRTILLLLVFPVWVVLIISAFFLYLLPVTYVAFRIWKMLFKLEPNCTCCQSIPVSVRLISLPALYILFIVFCICVEASYFMLILEISINIVFLGSVIGFTTMGVIFYIDAYISYVVVIALALYYIAKAIQRFHFKLKRLKGIIFKECEAHDNELRAEASIRETFSGQTGMSERTSSTSSLQKSTKSVVILVFYDEQNIPNISLKLFLMVLNELLPFKRVLLAKILSLLVIFIYLMLVFFFVMSLVEFQAANSVVQALALLLLGLIPAVFKGNPSEFKEKEEKGMTYQVQEQIKKYRKRFL